MSILRRTCVACGTSGDALCPACVRRLSAPPTTRVRGVGRVDALFAYDGVGARVIRSLKFHDARTVVAVVADDLSALVAARVEPDVVSWLPTSPRRRRDRGFDQAELLARAVARRLGVEARPVLRRVPGPAQTGRSWEERADNVEFRLARRARGLSATVAFLDDVCTTGATVRAADAVVSGHSGLDGVYFALARTP